MHVLYLGRCRLFRRAALPFRQGQRPNPASSMNVRDVVKYLFQSLNIPLEPLENHLHLTGDPQSVLPSSFNLGIAAQASIAASGLSAALLHELRTSQKQNVTVDARHAALEFCSESYCAINGTLPGSVWDDIAGVYPTKDASFVRIHTNFPHHRAGILSILGLPSPTTRETVARALSFWDSKEFEAEAARKGMCATAMRSFEEWDRHPHGSCVKTATPVQLLKIGDAPKRSPTSQHTTDHPLSGIRVLDLTRVLAGPICGRTLAAHGADVLLITSPKLPSIPNLDVDTCRGKRTTQLDLTTTRDRDQLWSLVRSSDVFLQGYRPGGLADKGFSSSELARAKPGIVCANLSAWGWEGPWKDNRGFDSLVQTATGFNVAEAKAYAAFKGESMSPGSPITPRPFPVQALDHAAAYMLAFGINAALCKTMTEGGSWEVRVSLADIGNWVRSLGSLGPDGFKNSLPERAYPPVDEIAVLSTEIPIAMDKERYGDSSSSSGKMLALRHSAILDKTPVIERVAPVRLDVNAPRWLPLS